MLFKYLVMFLMIYASKIKGHPLDYSFNIQAEGWFKVYETQASWSEAFARCDVDGGVIASPLTKKIRDALADFLKDQGFKGTSILTGVRSDFDKGDFFSIEGFPLSKMPVFTNLNSSVIRDSSSESCIVWTTGTNDVHMTDCDVEHEFVCYKQTRSAKAVIGCGTRDPAYAYDTRSGSCYKWHQTTENWFKAYEKCNSEGAHLVIINSEVEQSVVKELFPRCSPNEVLPDCQETEIMALMGIRNWPDDGKSYLTIKRETLSESGFEKWLSGKPGDTENARCVTLDRQGNYVNVYCEAHFPFICEKVPEFAKLQSNCASTYY